MSDTSTVSSAQKDSQHDSTPAQGAISNHNSANTGVSSNPNNHPSRIVIIGGGAGGLSLAAKLGRKFRRDASTEVVLIDQTPTHLWKPLLHEVATGSLDSHHDQVSYVSLARKHGFHFVLGTLDAIDADARTVTVTQHFGFEDSAETPRVIHYNQAVLAIGSLSNDFGTAGVAENAYMLDHQTQAESFHQQLVARLHQADAHASGSDSQSDATRLSVVIVGGGATGVELAADLHSVASQLGTFGFTHVSPDNLQISVLEAGDRLLAQLPQRISDSVRKELIKLGVNVCTNTLVTEVTRSQVMAKDGTSHPADLCVWAAGIRAPNLLAESGLQTDRIGRVQTTQFLNLEQHPEVFVIGDCCHCRMPNSDDPDATVPPRAQSAHQMSGQTYKNLLRQRQSKPLIAFSYQDFGSLVSLSEYSTVGNLMGNLMRGSLFIEGALARLIYRLLYRRHQMAVHGVFATMLIMIGDKIHAATHSHLKLH